MTEYGDITRAPPLSRETLILLQGCICCTRDITHSEPLFPCSLPPTYDNVHLEYKSEFDC